MTDYRKGRPKQRFDAGTSLANYVPPQDVEAEQSLLGAMLIERMAIDKGVAIIPSADSFYREAHQTLWLTIITIWKRNEPVDLITVQAELKNHDKLEAIGGLSYLTVLYDRVPTAVNVEHYANIVEEKAILRRLISAAFEIIGNARGEIDNLADVVYGAQKSVFSVADQFAKREKGAKSEQLGCASDRLYDEAAERAEQRRLTGEVKLTGSPFPFSQLQKWSRGMQRGLLTVWAARPSMGKTSCALYILLQAAMRGECVLFESLETTIDTITFRCIAMIAGITQDQILVEPHTMSGEVDGEWQRWQDATKLFMSLKFEIDKPQALTPSRLASKVREMERQGRKPDIVCIDYVQLMKPDTKMERRDLEVQSCVADAKALAGEMDFALLALAQVNRECEKRDNKRPTMSDIRESGGIEADADLCVLMYRDAYYAKKDGTWIDERDWQIVELIVGKNKDGPTGTVEVDFLAEIGRWGEKGQGQRELELVPPPEGTRVPYTDDRDDAPFGF